MLYKKTNQIKILSLFLGFIFENNFPLFRIFFLNYYYISKNIVDIMFFNLSQHVLKKKYSLFFFTNFITQLFLSSVFFDQTFFSYVIE